MKKYLYSLAFVGAIVYSCKTQSTPPVPAPKDSPAVAANDVVAKGSDLFTQRCGKCHELPSAAEFTSEQWKPIIDRMAPKAKLTEEETNWVLAYVNANAKK